VLLTADRYDLPVNKRTNSPVVMLPIPAMVNAQTSSEKIGGVARLGGIPPTGVARLGNTKTANPIAIRRIPAAMSPIHSNLERNQHITCQKFSILEHNSFSSPEMDRPRRFRVLLRDE
jgi:hypothetical protein